MQIGAISIRTSLQEKAVETVLKQIGLIFGDQHRDDGAIPNAVDAFRLVQAGPQLALGDTDLGRNPSATRRSADVGAEVRGLQTICVDLLSRYVELALAAIDYEVSQNMRDLRSSCRFGGWKLGWSNGSRAEVGDREEIARHFTVVIAVEVGVIGRCAVTFDIESNGGQHLPQRLLQLPASPAVIGDKRGQEFLLGAKLRPLFFVQVAKELHLAVQEFAAILLRPGSVVDGVVHPTQIRIPNPKEGTGFARQQQAQQISKCVRPQ